MALSKVSRLKTLGGKVPTLMSPLTIITNNEEPSWVDSDLGLHLFVD